MLAIVFKEIRENIVWALLILLALGASMALASLPQLLRMKLTISAAS